jgi:hypothetical protein
MRKCKTCKRVGCTMVHFYNAGAVYLSAICLQCEYMSQIYTPVDAITAYNTAMRIMYKESHEFGINCSNICWFY